MLRDERAYRRSPMLGGARGNGLFHFAPVVAEPEPELPFDHELVLDRLCGGTTLGLGARGIVKRYVCDRDTRVDMQAWVVGTTFVPFLCRYTTTSTLRPIWCA